MNKKFRLPVKIEFLRIITPILTALLVGAAFLVFVNSQRVAHAAAVRSQQAVAAHTETLNQINNVVTQLKKNNQVNHDTTITYIQCNVNLFVKVSEGTPVSQADFNACIANSGIVETTK